MKKTLETSKGRFVVMEASDWGLTKKQLYELEFPIVEKIGFIHNITELEAKSIVNYIHFNYRDKDYKLFRDYKLSVGNYCGRLSAIQSLHSLLESQGIEITNNTYIFKV